MVSFQWDQELALEVRAEEAREEGMEKERVFFHPQPYGESAADGGKGHGCTFHSQGGAGAIQGDAVKYDTKKRRGGRQRRCSLFSFSYTDVTPPASRQARRAPLCRALRA